MNKLVYYLLGLGFGYLLSRGGATDYGVIQRMFLLESFQMYGVIGTAVVLTAPLMYGLRKAYPQRFAFTIRPSHKGNIVGGAIFGMGWALTGMCPAPIIVNIGDGKLYALAVMVGTLAGGWVYGATFPFLTTRLGLPQRN